MQKKIGLEQLVCAPTVEHSETDPALPRTSTSQPALTSKGSDVAVATATTTAQTMDSKKQFDDDDIAYTSRLDKLWIERLEIGNLESKLISTFSISISRLNLI